MLAGQQTKHELAVYPDTDATLEHSLLIAYNMRIIHKGTDQNLM